jgi:hypothetical protein
MEDACSNVRLYKNIEVAEVKDDYPQMLMVIDKLGNPNILSITSCIISENKKKGSRKSVKGETT